MGDHLPVLLSVHLYYQSHPASWIPFLLMSVSIHQLRWKNFPDDVRLKMHDLDQMMISCFLPDLCLDVEMENFSHGAWSFHCLIVDPESYLNLRLLNFTQSFYRNVRTIAIKREFIDVVNHETLPLI